jgi:hypothetical protein
MTSSVFPPRQSYIDQILAELGSPDPANHPAGKLYLDLARAIEDTIDTPWFRAQFAGLAVGDMARVDFAKVDAWVDAWVMNRVAYLAAQAEAERPTPLGTTYLWGSALELLDEEAA